MQNLIWNISCIIIGLLLVYKKTSLLQECAYKNASSYVILKKKKKRSILQVILAPSPKYTGVLDEPPRYMGEGFVVMSSSLVNFYHYMDEPGVVPEHPQVNTF